MPFSAASLTDVYVTVSPASMRTRSPADGTRAGDHVSGSDDEPERALVIVGFAQKSGTPPGSGV
ncbi:MAG TPA: hypothetical protein VGQ16_17660 [Vicinamibacterales bacterium]|nr:hypothetical protein [Vicinamibacterales bacterium]